MLLWKLFQYYCKLWWNYLEIFFFFRMGIDLCIEFSFLAIIWFVCVGWVVIMILEKIIFLYSLHKASVTRNRSQSGSWVLKKYIIQILIVNSMLIYHGAYSHRFYVLRIKDSKILTKLFLATVYATGSCRILLILISLLKIWLF